MVEIVIRLKSGRELTVFCERCTVTQDAFGNFVGADFKGLKNIKPLFLNTNDIELVYEVLHTEREIDK